MPNDISEFTHVSLCDSAINPVAERARSSTEADHVGAQGVDCGQMVFLQGTRQRRF
jgi:hypothetical protein